MMKSIGYGCWMGVFSFFLIACAESSPLELALKRAGDNRMELEKILQHYSECPQKRDAAEYLIANMPYHFSRESFFVNRDGKEFRPDMSRIADKQQMARCVDS